MIKHTFDAGKTAVELLLVMILLLLFALSALTLVASGSDVYIETVDEGNIQSDLRIAQSYFHTKLRQNNVQGAVRIESVDGLDSPILLISDTDYNSGYVTAVFTHGGILYDALIPEGEVPSAEMGFKICDLDGFKISPLTDKGFSLKTWRIIEGREVALESFFNIALGE